jgi:PAS domain S-box-containing protein
MATELFKRPVLVLHLEDNENDHVLVGELLRADGLRCEMVAVKTADDFEAALRETSFDLIISDFSLPSFDGLRALSIARKLSPWTPFIFFSGTIGEEVAVESLKHGATDYILKQRPQRLISAVQNALRVVGERAQRQRMEGELRQMEERLRIVARASNDVVWEWDIKTGKVWFSENFQNVFGYAREDIGARLENWHQLLHPDDHDRVLSGLMTMLAGGGRIWWSEHRLRRANGSYLHVYDRASVIYDAANKPLRMVGMAIDMTERKQAEEKIREQAELLDKARDAIIVCNLDRTIAYWNKGAERIYGWNAREAVGQNIRELLLHGQMPPQLAEGVKILEERGEWMGELSEFTKGNTPVVVQVRSTLIRDEEGRPKSLLIINTDITERKLLEEKFLRTQRLESLGALVGGIAHDLNNALVPIIVGVEVLRARPLSPDAESMVRTMETSARRSSEMIKQMLLFARGGESVKTVIHMDGLLKEMGKIVTDTFPKNIRSRVQLGKNIWPVFGFPTQLHQVLMNLCVNARDAMPKGGILTLLAENAKFTAAEAAQHHDAKPGNYLCITVADTGGGIPADMVDKIFQPFFTTKAPGKGTGLGLSTCQSIVQNHGGFMTVQSKVNAGADFKVFLPAAELRVPESAAAKAASANRATAEDGPPAGHGERVLVVDDEESILAITRAALQNYGYEVLTAGGGAEAITRFAQNPDDIRLVICDLAMPLMDGRATLKALRKIRPDFKAIIASGSGKEMKRMLEEIKHDSFLAKPFTNEALLGAVHDVLAEK